MLPAPSEASTDGLTVLRYASSSNSLPCAFAACDPDCTELIIFTLDEETGHREIVLGNKRQDLCEDVGGRYRTTAPTEVTPNFQDKPSRRILSQRVVRDTPSKLAALPNSPWVCRIASSI
jgi:hypothetical protein